MVDEYFKLYAAWVAARTAKKYRSALNMFLDWMEHDATTDRITPEVWHEFKIYLASDDPATGRRGRKRKDD